MTHPTRTPSVTISVCKVSHCADDSSWVCCRECGTHLDLQQPKTEQPHRLVGTCHRCGAWYLLDWWPGSAEGLMLLLPDHEELWSAAPKGTD